MGTAHLPISVASQVSAQQSSTIARPVAESGHLHSNQSDIPGLPIELQDHSAQPQI